MAERGRPRSFDRTQALAKAMELFWEKGYEGASMAELTSVMGIGSPSLYAAFGSKEGLFREAVALYSTTDGAPIWASALTAPTAYDTVEALLMTTAREFSRSDKPRGCMVILSALHATEANATVRAELAARRTHSIQVLAEHLGLGIERGELPPTVDLEAVARYYITVQQGMSIQARDGADREALEGVALYLITVQQGMSIQARDGAGRVALESIARSALAAWQPLTQAAPSQG